MTDDGPSARRRKLFALAKNELGLTDDERHELAEWVLRRDISSWSQLDDAQVCRMLDTIEGFIWVSYLLGLRPTVVTDGEAVAHPEPTDATSVHAVVPRPCDAPVDGPPPWIPQRFQARA